ncbi:probable elongation factor 1-delta [Cylas formicarius]|uniref:probable elongation factor 1-delta n=1 Tax=Cylas formicarius TaxID=197179 RepID=UPI002958AFB1|nr:probable elongation factor 1-delta [Cylas formicarius]
MKSIGLDGVWLSKKVYEAAEADYYANVSKAVLTPLADEIAKTRQKLIESRDAFTSDISSGPSVDVGAFKFIEKKVMEFEKSINTILEHLQSLNIRVTTLEGLVQVNHKQPVHEINIKSAPKKDDQNDDDDDIDLFASGSDEEDEETAKIREERLAAYAAKKSKKPVLIAKSNVILDVKPWDDETDMAQVEANVRAIESDGLLWGASKLVPLAYGIRKLQISSVVEDDKVSIDWLTEQIEELELVQSVDIAAFNKI